MKIVGCIILVVGILLICGAYEFYNKGPNIYGGIGEYESYMDWEGWRNVIIKSTAIGVALIAFGLVLMLKGRKEQ